MVGSASHQKVISKFSANSWEKLVDTRILIVDDSPLVRQRLRDLLHQHPHWQVCGEAANGQDAITRARDLAPDVIVLDFLMPGMNGVQAARENPRRGRQVRRPLRDRWTGSATPARVFLLLHQLRALPG